MTPEDLLSAGRLVARRKAPYLRAILMTFEVRWTDEVATAAATEKGVLLVNRDFIAQLGTVEAVAAVWGHETVHRLLDHSNSERCGARDRGMWNEATDCVANVLCEKLGFAVKSLVWTDKETGQQATPVFPEKYKAPRGITVEEYYEIVRKQQQSSKRGGASSPKGIGSGGCGGCSGNRQKGEPEAGTPEAGTRSAGELRRAMRSAAEDIKAHAQKQRGELPAELQRFADSVLTPPKVNWRTMLQHELRTAVAWKTGGVDLRYDGPSRRQAGLGYGANRAVLPRMRAPIPIVDVIGDTSGSMGQRELNAVGRETIGIIDALGAKVRFAACDAACNGIAEVASIQDIIKAMKGGGGTDMTPAFNALAKRAPRGDVIVCLTDGYIGDGFPKVPPAAKTIWVVIGGFKGECAPWGKHIYVDD